MLVGIVAAAALLGAVTLVVRGLFLVVTVQGTSMAPTLRDGDRVVVRRRLWRLPVRGDVVAVHMPLGYRFPGPIPGPRTTDELLIKRVTAVAGDLLPPGVPGTGGRLVPAGTVVVHGDGAMSLDSSVWGCVPVSRVVGVMTRRMASPSRRVAPKNPGQ